MASLKELEGPSPIQDFITQVIQTVNPSKENMDVSEMIRDVSMVVMPEKEYKKSAAAKRRRATKVAARKAEAKPPPSSKPKDPNGGVAKQDHSATSKKTRKDDADNQKKDYLAKIGGASGLAGLAALGITAAAAATMAGLAAADSVACEDAVITIKSISPKTTIPDWIPDWAWLKKMFPDPSTVTVTYSSSTSYTPLEGKDSWEISGTNTELDGGNWKILKIPSSGTVIINCKSKKCSNVLSSTGTADINCADFGDRMNARISDAATDIASTVGKGVKGFADAFTGNLPLILFIVAIIAVVFFVIPLFKS
jgi:hypothetical protein